MAKRLTKKQKEMISTLLANGSDVADIAEQFNVTPAVVQKLQTPVVAVKEQSGLTAKDIKDTVIRLRLNTGYDAEKCKELVQRVITKIDNVENASQLYDFALQQVKSLESIVTKSSSGRSGVAIMTGAGSARGDTAPRPKSEGPVQTRITKGTMFSPKTGESYGKDD